MDFKKINSRVRLDKFDSSFGLNRGRSRFVEISWYLVKMFFFLTAFPFPNHLKKSLLSLFGAKLGSGVVIKPRVNIHMPWKLIVGNHVWLGEEVFILNLENVFIGNNVCVSQRSFLCTGNHDFKFDNMPYRNGPITLEDGSWIGASCFIGPGVTVGIDSVVAAGSVVTKDVAGNRIFRGNPVVEVGIRWK